MLLTTDTSGKTMQGAWRLQCKYHARHQWSALACLLALRLMVTKALMQVAAAAGIGMPYVQQEATSLSLRDRV